MPSTTPLKMPCFASGELIPSAATSHCHSDQGTRMYTRTVAAAVAAVVIATALIIAVAQAVGAA